MDNIEKARITRAEAALLAGVSERTISRWNAEGLLDVKYPPRDKGVPRWWALPATYDPDEVLRVAGRNADLAALARGHETDIST